MGSNIYSVNHKRWDFNDNLKLYDKERMKIMLQGTLNVKEKTLKSYDLWVTLYLLSDNKQNKRLILYESW